MTWTLNYPGCWFNNGVQLTRNIPMVPLSILAYVKQHGRHILTWASVLVTVLVGLWFLWNGAMVHLLGIDVSGSQSAARDITKMDLEAIYASGNRELWLVTALADQRAVRCSGDNAIAVLLDYVATNPNDAQGRKKLAEHYGLAARYDEFQKEYEVISELEPIESNLTVLSKIYSAQGKHLKQIDILRKIIDATKGRKPKYFLDLAITQQITGHSKATQTTLKELRAHHPDYMDYRTVRIEVTNAIEQEKIDAAYTQATAWIARQNDRIAKGKIRSGDALEAMTPEDALQQLAKELAELSWLFLRAYQPVMASTIIVPYDAWLANSPDLALAYVDALIAQGKLKKTYQKIQSLDQAQTLGPRLYIPYVKLAAMYGNDADQLAVTHHLNPFLFDEEQAISLLFATRGIEKPKMLHAIAKRFNDPSILVAAPVLHVFVDWVTASRNVNPRIQKAFAVSLKPVQHKRLAQLCSAIPDELCFQAIVKQLGNVEQIQAEQIKELAEIYMVSHRANELVDVFTMRMQQPSTGETFSSERLRLAAAGGRDDIIRAWLKASMTSDRLNTAIELFHLANSNHHANLAAEIAEVLYQYRATGQHRGMVIDAYIAGRKIGSLMDFIHADSMNRPENKDRYSYLLRTHAFNDATMRERVVAYCTQIIRAGKVPAHKKLICADILIIQGAAIRALDYIQANAVRYGEPWQSLATQLTYRLY